MTALEKSPRAWCRHRQEKPTGLAIGIWIAIRLASGFGIKNPARHAERGANFIPPRHGDRTCYRNFIPPHPGFYSPSYPTNDPNHPLCFLARRFGVARGVGGAGRLRFPGLVEGRELAGSRVGVPAGVGRERRAAEGAGIMGIDGAVSG